MRETFPLEQKSIYLIREGIIRSKKPAILWSCGKDSTTMLSLIRDAFGGAVPIPVIFIDTGYHMPELLEFRDECVDKWNLNLVIAKAGLEDETAYTPEKNKLDCCYQRKTLAVKLIGSQFDLLILGIRRDEHGVRAKERVFSQRTADWTWDFENQPPELWYNYVLPIDKDAHTRLHPLLHWTELDVWKYLKDKQLPICPLYYAVDGFRFRSLGCKPCTKPIESDADTIDKIIKEVKESRIAERSGRSQDKEDSFAMERLKALGYM